ncbi:MAG: hypothetical protein FJ264_02885 [Planctomycetes bacterium]|nr:hypothetical protein [Planctomycetota bacterium]
MIVRGKILLLRDTFCDFLPWRIFAREAIRSGTMPLWNPYSRLGQPFLACPQTAIFYPFNAFFYVLPIAVAYRCFIILHIFLAGVFMFLLMKHWKVVRTAAFTSAIIFMFNGMIISRLEFLSYVSTIPWIPLIFFLFDKTIKNTSLMYSLLAGIILAIQFFGGHSLAIYFTYLSLGFYCIFTFLLLCYHGCGSKKIFFVFIFPLLAFVVAFLLSMVQLLPTLEATKLSVRAINFDPELIIASLHPLHLITFLVPYFFGVPGFNNDWWGISLFEFWTGSFYIGIFPLTLLLFAIIFLFFHNQTKRQYTCSATNEPFVSHRYLTAFFCILSAFLFILASGMYTPMYHFFNSYLPFMKNFRWPSRNTELAVFSLSIITGFGTHYLLFSYREIKENKRRLFISFVVLISFYLIFICLILLAYLFPSVVVSVLEKYINKIQNPSLPFSIEQRYYYILKNCLYMLFFLSTTIAIIFLCTTHKLNYKLLNILITTIIVSDLFFFFKNLNYYDDNTLLEKKPGIINFVSSDKDICRIINSYNNTVYFLYGCKDISRFFFVKSILAGETSLPYHLFKFRGGGNPIILNYFEEFFSFLDDNASLKTRNDFYRMLNLKYIITNTEIDDNIDAKTSVAQVKNVFPRIFFVNKITSLNEKHDIFQTLFSEKFDPFREIVIETPKNIAENFFLESKEILSEIKNLVYPSNKITLQTNTDKNCFLVLSDTYYPGWKAYVDGKETTIYKTDYIIRSIFLEKGLHNVEFVYDPITFKTGCIITLSTLFILISYVSFHYGKKWKININKKTL